MANLGKKWTCFACDKKFYDMGKADAVCPGCGANQKAAPPKAKTTRREKAALSIDDDYGTEVDAEGATEEGFDDGGIGIPKGRPEGDPGDLNMDDYDE